MKKLLVKLLSLLILIHPISVKAGGCNKEEMLRINSLINNIKITYTHVENNKFNINFYNIPKELYIFTPSNENIYHSDNNFSTINNYLGGNSYTFNIYSLEDNNCINDMNYTKTIYVKKYNVYSEKEICKNEEYNDFKLCNKWYQGSITDEKFEKELQTFKNNIINNTDIIDENNRNKKYNNILIVSIVFSGILVVSLIVIIVVKKKRRKKI